ncbi:MAG: efflux RND transporter periplasmic adaptor subunit [Deltaproteobacteria bacterium HGW-Deltaproteobacteria-21]|nr:MAG: efflux RND transporter periplasmic adaptor subunit [Deltaproteobacteria bacterium HGW-Deltaproteobacteria-21]
MTEPDISRLRIDRNKFATRKSRKKRNLLFLIPVLLIAVGLYFYWTGALKPALEVQAVPVQTIFPSQTLTLLNASGYVVAQRKAAVSSKATGRLVSLHVEEGDRVKKDQLIAVLDNEDVRASRARAEANVHLSRSLVERAKAELIDATLAYNRNKELASKGFVARSVFDSSEARYRMARAEVAAQEAALRASQATLAEAEVLLEYSYIRAPFDAVVLTKNADIGDMVTPLAAAANAKAAVVTIADMDSLMVEVDVAESNLAPVRPGQPCEIRLDALPQTRFPGTVHMIVPTADRTKASVMVKVAFREKSSQVLPEMSAKVAFLSRELSSEERAPFKAIPSSALIERNGRTSVFVLQGERAALKQVRTGRRYNELAEALEGVEPGERVIVPPFDKIKEGVRVKVPDK